MFFYVTQYVLVLAACIAIYILIVVVLNLHCVTYWVILCWKIKWTLVVEISHSWFSLWLIFRETDENRFESSLFIKDNSFNAICWLFVIFQTRGCKLCYIIMCITYNFTYVCVLLKRQKKQLIAGNKNHWEKCILLRS